MNYLKIAILFTCIFSLSICRIVPDTLNPIQFSLPNTSKQTSIFLKFSLVDSTINYGNQIGVRFPTNIASLAVPDVSSCQLTSGNNNYNVNKLPATGGVSGIAETHVIYCQFLDTTVGKLGSGATYTLRLTMNGAINAFYFIRFQVFIASSRTPNQVISDSAIFGNAAQYSDYSNSNPTPLVIETATMTPTTGACSTRNDCSSVFPGNSFNLNIKLVTNSYVPALRDAIIVFQWDAVVNSDNLMVTSRDYTTNTTNETYKALKSSSTFKLEPFVGSSFANSFILRDVGENLVNDRKFELVISGFTAKSETLASAGLSLFVYWKNTYSILSYSNKTNVFNVIKNNIRFTPTPETPLPSGGSWNGIAHPEFFDIYESGSWPLRFIFEVEAVPEGGYLKIEHVNSSETKIWQFIPSTCDFSDPENSPHISNELGSRPVCYSSNSSIDQPNVESGIFFKLPSISSKQKISVTVWGVAVKCSENDVLAASYVNLADDLSLNSSVFEFQYTIYNKIDQTSSSLFSAGDIIAQSSVIQMFGKCHGAVPFDDTLAAGTFNNILPMVNNTVDYLLYAEFNDFTISKADTYDPTSPPAGLYYYSTSSTNLVGDHNLQFGHHATGQITGTADEPAYDYFPMPIENESGYAAYKGTLTLQLSRLWVSSKISSEEDCTMNWFTWNQLETGNSDSNNNFITSLSTASSGKIISNSGNNNFLQAGGYQLDNARYIPPIRIESDILNSAGSQFPELAVHPTSTGTTNYIEFLVFDTDCYRPSIPASSIKSLYTYLDFTYYFTRDDDVISNRPMVTRVGRFIKLFTEWGVIRDPNDTDEIASSTAFALHFIWSASASARGVCLLEVSKSVLDIVGVDSNTLIITLINIELLQPDYSNVASRYPAAPIVESTIYVYGNPITYPFNLIYPQGTLNSYPGSSADSYIRSLMSEIPTDVALEDMKSHYFYSFGSTLLLSGANSTTKISSSSQTNESRILVPVLCPLGSSTADDLYTQVPPSAIAMTATMTGYNDIQSLTPYYQASTTNFKIGINFGESAVAPAATVYESATLKFNRFSDTSSAQNNLYFWASSTNDQDCDVLALFLRDDITLDGTTTYKGTASLVSNGANEQNFKFYYYKRAFNKAILNLLGSPETFTTTSTFDSLSSTYFGGIKQPSPISLITGNFAQNSAAFTCVDSTVANRAGTGIINLSSSNFSVGFFEKISTSGFEASFSFAVPSQITYKDDRALALNFGFKIPIAIPSTAELTFTSNSINNNSLCAMKNTDPTKPSIPCNDISSTSVTCSFAKYGSVLSADQTVDVCCYNALSSTNAPSINSISLKAGTITLASHGSLTNSAFNTQTSTTETSANLIISINNISYFPVNQMNGLTRAYINISLGRQVVRNSQVRITGALSDLYIGTGVRPNCAFTLLDTTSYNSVKYGQNLDTGDFLVDRCDINVGTLGSAHTIDLYNKKVIYRCGEPVSSTILLILWPVRAQNLAESSSNKYTLAYGLGGISENLARPAIPENAMVFPTTTFDTGAYTLSLTPRENQLCNLVRVFPRVAGIPAMYQFEIDLTDFPNVNEGTNTNKEPNEYTIVWPRIFNGSLGSIDCRYQNNPIMCDLDQYNFLNIRVDSALATGAKHTITVRGVVNPILTSSNESFQCSVNYYNPATSKRENLLTGSGTNAFSTFSPANQGNLIFLYSGPPASQVPRTNSQSLDLAFMIDQTQRMNQLPQILTASESEKPLLIIDFPPEFNLEYSFGSSSISVSILKFVPETEETIISANPTLRMTKNATPPGIESVEVVLNRVIIRLSAQTLEIDSATLYYVVRFGNVPGPWREYSTAGVSRFRITLMNEESNPSQIFTSYDNLNNQWTNTIDAVSNSNLNWYRGFRYTFSNTAKSVINIESSNAFSLNPGRYRPITVVVTSAINVGNAGETTIALNSNPVFSTLETNLIINTGLRRNGNMNIGCKCSTIPGTRIVTFSSSNLSEFYYLSPVRISVQPVASSYGSVFLAKTSIGVSTTTFSSAPGGLLRVFIRASDKPFEKIAFSFKDAKDYTNNAFSMIQNSGAIEISPGKDSTWFRFVNTDTETSEAQKYNIISRNNCFRFSGLDNTDFTINMDFTLADLTSLDLSDKFTYVVPSNTDAVLNRIKFTYKNTIPNVILNTCLVCADAIYPTEQHIIAQSEDTDPTLNPALVQYNWRYFESEEEIELVFDGLYRGKQYKLMSVVTNTAANNTSLKSIGYEEFNIIGGANNPVKIQTIALESPQCLQYTFSVEQSNDTLQALHRAAQMDVTRNGFQQDGCIIVLDSKNNKVIGYSLNEVETCRNNTASGGASNSTDPTNSTNSTSGNSTDNNSTGSNNSTTSNGNSTNSTNTTTTGTGRVLQEIFSYSLCGIQDPICSTSSNLVDTMNRIRDATTDAESLSNYLQRTIQGSVSVSSITDSPLDLTKIIISSFSYNGNRTNFTIAYDVPQKTILCYWKLNDQAQSASLDVSEIQNCTKIENSTVTECGSIYVRQTPTNYTYVIGFLEPGNYNIWLYCTNDLPGATQSSSPQSVGFINVPQFNNGTNNDTDDNDTYTGVICIPGVVTEECPEYARYLTMSFSLVLLIVVFLF